MMLRVFSFSLMESAKDWYHTLSPSSGTTWMALKKLFLDKYFPIIKRNRLRKQICTIEQLANESLHEYYESFKKFLKSCPYHGFPKHDLILNLHEGLCEDDRRMVNSTCGENILNMTYEKALNIFTTLEDDSRQYGGRGRKRGIALVSDFDKEDYELLKEEVRRLKNATQDQIFSPQAPIPSMPNRLEENIKLLMQNNINLNESLAKLSQIILDEREATRQGCKIWRGKLNNYPKPWHMIKLKSQVSFPHKPRKIQKSRTLAA